MTGGRTKSSLKIVIEMKPKCKNFFITIFPIINIMLSNNFIAKS